MRVYTVQPGDTLWEISRKFGVSVGLIKKANCIGDVIQVGWVLYIPRAFQRYIVQWGDTLWGISQRFGTTVALLKRANCLSQDMIHAGQILRIPLA
ncbi:LysM peptidoglycan-binding domain-containing protein [Paenibacillus ehimensis]|uniref:LysM peptidoglycan-binding domain-containing protein n=2 Tax=Paenibacillus ehimensis TaxID=79264 RepID=A0ABT8V6R5_9BACL|nr:LysM peptidoglycan-binding domain-containing protein [Paenibacillus ehimensis]MDO3675665.1 LysM peptidoglycan-binding domain-containing protein [Paenibacillus ehimensis]MEC0207401.1 LysM peptidoglycan-binding domain-containing protein [Paenibacillus ehimensis]